MRKTFDIVIVGGGITGLTAAAILAASKHRDQLRIRVVDAQPQPQPVPDDEISLRVSAIATGSAALLDRVGAWPHIGDAQACPYERMQVWDASDAPDSPTALCFDAADFAIGELGFIVENARLRSALFAALGSGPVEFAFDATIDSLESSDEGHRLVLEDGRPLHADLVIAADGARSWVRNRFGIETHEQPYGQTAFVTHVRPERPHRNTAWQRFLADGPLGMLPLPDGRVSVVWSTTDAQAQEAYAASDTDLGRLLTSASDYVLGTLTTEGPRGNFALHARHAEHYVLPGIALIGDAAHAVHPLAGQGANLGLQDAEALAGVIDAALAANEHPGDRPVLRRYERERKGANANMLRFVTMLNRLFASDVAALRVLRKTGMRLFNNSGPLRDYVVGVALGTGRQDSDGR